MNFPNARRPFLQPFSASTCFFSSSSTGVPAVAGVPWPSNAPIQSQAKGSSPAKKENATQSKGLNHPLAPPEEDFRSWKASSNQRNTTATKPFDEWDAVQGLITAACKRKNRSRGRLPQEPLFVTVGKPSATSQPAGGKRGSYAAITAWDRRRSRPG